jgi:hypothetical protein
VYFYGLDALYKSVVESILERIKAVFHYGPGQRRLIGKFVIEFTDKLDEPMVLTA